ncbi:hypothetical protein ACFVFQ_12920 [Streptomyces sp. NPDC057743]|uniref:hypothetical protein n=1 Tax=Streptomyces sp. NPDC057743 TaxID=3346236 RepID=UPI0036BAB490
MPTQISLHHVAKPRADRSLLGVVLDWLEKALLAHLGIVLFRDRGFLRRIATALVEELEEARTAWLGALAVASHGRLQRRRFGDLRYEIRGGRPTLVVC